MFNKKITGYLGIIWFFLVLFLLANVVWYMPIIFKGYPAYTLSPEIVLARNLNQSGVFGMEDKNSIILSTDQSFSSLEKTTLGNKLTPIAYSFIFKVFGDQSISQLIIMVLILYSLALVIFSFAVFLIFDIKTAFLFGIFYIFFPFSWVSPLFIGGFEFAVFFSSLFFLFYILALKRKKYIYYFISGIFLCLTGLAREAFWPLALMFFIYLLATGKKKELVYTGLSFFAILAFFWIPSAADNVYIAHIFGRSQSNESHVDFSMYGEFFPDPYIYLFEKDEYLSAHQVSKTLNPISSLGDIKLQSNIGVRSMSIYERLVIGSFLLSKHLFKFLSLDQVGGPLVFLIMLFGFLSLWKKNKELLKLFLFWIMGSLIVISFVVVGSRSHLIDFIFPLSLFGALGLIYVFSIIKEKINLKNHNFLYTILAILVIYNFIQSSHNSFNLAYDSSNVSLTDAYAAKINELNISPDEVIVVNGNGYILNYLTNRSIVVIKEENLDKIIKEKKVNEVFGFFNAKYILGYSDEISNEISGLGIKNISSDSISIKENSLSTFKKYLMNFFR